ncbi:MAG: hypothetical protein GXC94_19500 [Comamonadaceae bacterium]|jgi:hypothetical protein|nr:hypothetical protein [Comamonadaceae bacterium]
MNAAAQTFAIALASVAAAAVIGIGLADSTAAPAPEVTRLERVVVVGHTAPLAPVAVVAGQPRASAPAVTVAQARPMRRL